MRREALAIGLLTEVVEDLPTLQMRADELAQLIAGHAPLTLRATKEALLRASAAADAGRGRGPDPDVLHEPGFPRGPRRVPHQARAAMEGASSSPASPLPRTRGRSIIRPGERHFADRTIDQHRLVRRQRLPARHATLRDCRRAAT